MDARELIQHYAAGKRDFTGIRIKGSGLENSDLPGIILKDAMLYNIEMQNANLEGADLDYADLTDADLEQASLIDAQTRMAIFCNTIMTDGTIRNDSCAEEKVEDEETVHET